MTTVRTPIMPGQVYEFVGQHAMPGQFEVVCVRRTDDHGDCAYEVTFRGVRLGREMDWNFHVNEPFADNPSFAEHHRLVEESLVA